MLTDSERVWLDRRGSLRWASCQHCPGKDVSQDDCVRACTEREMIPPCFKLRKFATLDSAEFEARVAAKLAMMMYQLAANIMSRDFSCEKSCVAHVVCQKNKSCLHSFLKYARIAVEEEMG